MIVKDILALCDDAIRSGEKYVTFKLPQPTSPVTRMVGVTLIPSDDGLVVKAKAQELKDKLLHDHKSPYRMNLGE